MKKLSLQKRVLTGNKAKRLLREGILPGVIYNSKGDSNNIQLSMSDAIKFVNKATFSTIVDLEIDGKNKKAIIKDTDINPRTDALRHISFFEIDATEAMTFDIPFELVGVSPAVKNSLGVLITVLPVLEVRCKVENLVPSIEIDISKLELPGQSISVSDITLPKGISLINEDLETSPIVTITQLQKQEVIEEVVTEEEGEEGEGEEGEEGDTVEGEETTEETSGEKSKEE
jgi:large subunit ribosomal protein L25